MTASDRTLLAFDYGTNKIGVAVGQTITGTASALPVIQSRQGKPDWDALAALVAQWKPGAFVIGMPYNMDGSEGPMTEKVSAFVRKLEALFSLPCHGVDERLSTREARDISRANAEASGKKYNDRAEVDSIAAQLILESWLSENS